jgi:two-component system NarL family response regulator
MEISHKMKVLIMHGESLIDAGLAATLTRHDDVEVLEPSAHDAAQTALVHWLAQERADILITDYDRGMRLADALQRTQVPFRPVRPRIMVVTSRATQTEIQGALKLGIGGYLLSTSRSDEVIDAVRKLHLGVRHVSEPLMRLLLDDMAGERLTPRETEVLRLAALGCANKVIAARLQVELGTVKCHMKAVLDKLGASNRTEAVVIAHRRGLLAPQAVVRDAAARRSPTPRDRKSHQVPGASARQLHETAASI